jgi:molecular chaperone GrpE
VGDEVKHQEFGSEQPATSETYEEAEKETKGAAAEENQATEIETMQRELAETRDQLMRVAAEFENFKKRMEREKNKLLKYAEENLLRDLLTTVDNLDRAVEQGNVAISDGEDVRLQAMLEGVELTRKGLVSTLERYGVEPIEAIGRAFNPDEHDALTMEASAEMPANHVIREFARGYRFKDRVLRHAQVIVSSGS